MTDLPSTEPVDFVALHESARQSALAMITDGSLTLPGLFEAIDAGSRNAFLGDISARDALLAHAHIDEKQADAIMADLALEPDAHISAIRMAQEQRTQMLAAVAA